MRLKRNDLRCLINNAGVQYHSDGKLWVPRPAIANDHLQVGSSVFVEDLGFSSLLLVPLRQGDRLVNRAMGQATAHEFTADGPLALRPLITNSARCRTRATRDAKLLAALSSEMCTTWFGHSAPTTPHPFG